jgi:drug/metabolite transporter (DMT)-like permease
VLLSLVFVQVSLALYAVLSKAALDTGMDAGVFTLVRDSVCAGLLNLNARRQMGRFTLPQGAADHNLFIILGTFGLYFGQFFATLGVKHGTPMLSATWSNSTPVAVYMLGLLLGVERLDRSMPKCLKVAGLFLAVGGAISATVVAADSKGKDGHHQESAGDLALASAFFSLQVLFGGAGFWHLQKHLLARYTAAQVAAWYYLYGVAILALTILPNATTASQWTFKGADLVALLYAVILWPVAAFLLTYANSRGTPVLVMAFAPLQIVAATTLDYMLESVVPTRAQIIASSVVVLGLACFIAGTFSEPEDTEQNISYEEDNNRTGHDPGLGNSVDLKSPLVECGMQREEKGDFAGFGRFGDACNDGSPT